MSYLDKVSDHYGSYEEAVDIALEQAGDSGCDCFCDSCSFTAWAEHDADFECPECGGQVKSLIMVLI